jgi:hypothetical protein
MYDRRHPTFIPTAPPPADSATPLTARQELFVQGLSQGMSLMDACRHAGYGQGRNGARILNMPNVKARYDALMAQRAARSEVTVAEITEGLRDVIAKTKSSEAAALQAQTRQAFMDLAKLHGHLSPKAVAAAGAFNPKDCACGGTGITEIRRVIVWPDGREEEYGK